MLTEAQRQESKRSGVRRWYGENRDDYNAVRRQRYADNKDVRNKARDRAAQRREEERDCPIEIGRVMTREVNGKEVEVFSTGQVAAIVERTSQMIRNWERAGLIPPSIFPDSHRFYTKAQVRKLVGLANIITENGGTWTSPKVKAKVRSIHKSW